MSKLTINWETYIISEEDLGRVQAWDPYSIIWSEIAFDEDAIALAQKRSECNDLILMTYSETDQRNLIMSGDQVAIDIMYNYIIEMTTEFQTNGITADYTGIVPAEPA